MRTNVYIWNNSFALNCCYLTSLLCFLHLCVCFYRLPDMELLWLNSLCQCILFASVIVASLRLCMAVRSNAAMADIKDGDQAARPQPRSVSCCLRLCLGMVGVIGGAVGIPETVLINLRTPQCLYTCITLVCCPLVIRQFTMCLLMLLTLDCHMQHHLATR